MLFIELGSLPAVQSSAAGQLLFGMIIITGPVLPYIECNLGGLAR